MGNENLICRGCQSQLGLTGDMLRSTEGQPMICCRLCKELYSVNISDDFNGVPMLIVRSLGQKLGAAEDTPSLGNRFREVDGPPLSEQPGYPQPTAEDLKQKIRNARTPSSLIQDLQ